MTDRRPDNRQPGPNTTPMAARVRDLDWAATPLGAPSAWPQALKTTLNLLLNSRFPMCLAWGEELIFFYNDAYRPLLGRKADALGRPMAEVWSEVWPTIAPLLWQALAGEGSYFEDFPLTIERAGAPEDTWWTFSYSPVMGEGGRVEGVLCIVHETTREVSARDTLKSDLERLSRAVEQAPGFIAFLSGPDHVYELVNAAQRRLAPGREILGRPVREAFPELAGQGIFELLDDVRRTGRPHVANGLRIELADASGKLSEHYVDFVYQPITGPHGEVVGIFVEGQDVTERIVADAAVRDREERLRLAIDAGGMATWEVDVATGVFSASPGLAAMLGLPTEGPLTVAELSAHALPGEFEQVSAAYRAAREQQQAFFEAEFRHPRADDGRIRWILMRGRTEVAGRDGVRRAFGVVIDLTERKEAEERLLLLTREVDHRANNLLAAVQSVVNLTRAEDIDSFRKSVRGRIGALAHAHRLLAESRWTGAGLARVVAEELEPYVESHVHTEGPDARLSPAVAQALAIALHELATNAAKYGALANPEGRTVVTWSAPDEQRLVRMTWRETGGTAIQAPPRAGFGMTLLQRAFAGQPGASVKLDWRPDGLCCTLTFPVL